MPAAQVSWYDQGMDWVVRADLSPGMAGRLRLAVADFDPRLRVDDMRTMEDVVASTTADSRFDAWLFGAFAAIALVLTTVGVYGLLSFSVAQRTAEIGTRMALGASRADVLRMVLRQGVTLVATGLVCGLAGALLLTRSLEQLLFGVKPTDPLSFAAVAVLLLAVGLAASYFPARRATKVDPIVALRYE
jgi:putative ABC transport system permease protein